MNNITICLKITIFTQYNAILYTHNKNTVILLSISLQKKLRVRMSNKYKSNHEHVPTKQDHNFIIVHHTGNKTRQGGGQEANSSP
jgi:hypothetical protein